MIYLIFCVKQCANNVREFCTQMIKRVFFATLCVLCATRLDGVIFQDIDDHRDSHQAIANFEPFTSQMCVVVTKKQQNGFATTGLLMDSQHVLAVSYTTFNAESVGVLHLKEALIEGSDGSLDAEKTWEANKGYCTFVQEVFPLGSLAEVPRDDEHHAFELPSGLPAFKSHVREAQKRIAEMGNLVEQVTDHPCVKKKEIRYKIVGPHLVLLRLCKPVKAVSLWDSIATGENIAVQDPCILTYAGSICDIKRQQAEFSTPRTGSPWLLLAAAQLPVKFAESAEGAKRTFCVSTYRSMHNERDQFVLSEEEKAVAPKHLGRLAEGNASGMLLGKIGGELRLIGVASCLLRGGGLEALNRVCRTQKDNPELKFLVDELKGFREELGAWPIHQVSERITPQIKSLLQDIVADRVAKEDIPAAWAAL